MCVQIFAAPWTAARQASLSFTISQSLLKLMSIESMMPSNHLILCHSLLHLHSFFPSIRVFSNESALCIRWPKFFISSLLMFGQPKSRNDKLPRLYFISSHIFRYFKNPSTFSIKSHQPEGTRQNCMDYLLFYIPQIPPGIAIFQFSSVQFGHSAVSYSL